MLLNSTFLSNNQSITTNVCIVGAGVAGILLARELIGESFDVCLLESGLLNSDKHIQTLCDGEISGIPYYPLDTARARQFGGSSNRWLLEIGDNQIGARLRPLDEIDFEQRDWVPNSGWPFDRHHLEPYYQRAQRACQSGPYTYDVGDWEDSNCISRLPFKSNRIETSIFQFTSRDVFVEQYLNELQQAKNITVVQNATVLEVETEESGKSVTSLRVSHMNDKQYSVNANLYVLALGGIETPRLLLLSNRTHTNGLGNHQDLVGRYFMEHPHLWSGFYAPNDRKIFNRAGLYKIHKNKDGIPVLGQLTISQEVTRKEKLLNYSVHIEPGLRQRGNVKLNLTKNNKLQGSTAKLLASAIRNRNLDDFNRHLSTLFPTVNDNSIRLYRKSARLFNKLFKHQCFEGFRLNHMVEQTPNPQSRVMLSKERDFLGQNKTCLHWQLVEQDISSIIRAQKIIDQELQLAKLGKLEIEMTNNTPPSDMHGGWHHMGTTRMHMDSRKGVVNENSKVHDISNLYIAGPSVFPTSGYANPVLTIAALTIRLADHIKEKMTLQQKHNLMLKTSKITRERNL